MLSSNTLSPNPAVDCLEIRSEFPIEEIVILDIFGTIHHREKEISDKKVIIHLPDLTPGIYALNITTEKGMTTKKLLISR